MIKLWIDALPDKRRKIFLMHYNDDLSTAEIAGRLNISRKTVQNQLNTASQALRLRLVQLLSLLILSSFISR
ncbi:RNA polymerase sigma factor [compost metagenome]